MRRAGVRGLVKMGVGRRSGANKRERAGSDEGFILRIRFGRRSGAGRLRLHTGRVGVRGRRGHWQEQIVVIRAVVP